MVCLLYGPDLKTIHDHWDDHIVHLTIWTFVGRVMSLLFNTLSSFVIAFLPRSSGLLISWLQSPSAVILKPKKRKSVTASTFPPSICHAVIGTDPDAGRDWGQEEEGTTEDEMAGWHH